MACECDQLMNELKRLRRDLDKLRQDHNACCGRDRNNGGTPIGRINPEEIIRKAVERTYSDKRWKDNETVLTFIIKGSV